MKQFYAKLTMIFTAVLLLSAIDTPLYAGGCSPKGDQVTYGTNNIWIGYVYQGTSFNTYKGYVNEGNASSPNFDQNFGGDRVNYSTNNCYVYTEDFSVRYKLTKTFANGTYVFTVSGDDGYRLSIDGGATWIINKWNDQSYTATSYTVQLNGTYNLVLEYYEHLVNNRLTFDITTTCTGTAEDPAVYGTNNVWKAYLYQGKNFETYKGSVTEGSSISANFDESFGGSNVSFSTSGCAVQTEQFSARFRLRMTLPAGTYIFTAGGDDGYRLSLDGGVTWVIDEWTLHSYQSKNYSADLNGTYDLVLEYFENGGDNRVTFGIVSTGALPVKLTAFTAKATTNNNVLLEWATAAATNFDHYVVERSNDGRSFSAIQTIAGKSHNSVVAETYAYTDQFSFDGTVYYRLAMVDIDGTTAYSNIQAVTLNQSAAGTIKVFPTIVTNHTIYLEADKAMSGKLEVYSMNGQQIFAKDCRLNSGRQSLTIATQNITSGTYLVRFHDDKGIMLTSKIIIR